MKHLILFAIFILAFTGCKERESVTETEENIPGTPHNKILYYKFDPDNAGSNALYLMDIYGKENTCITRDMGGMLWDARVSPDRSKIAFTLYLGLTNTYLMNWDGSNKTCLNNVMLAPRYPVVSPPGDKILFSSSKAGECGIYIINSDGTKTEKLTSDSADFKYPAYLSGGSAIVYTQSIDGKTDLYYKDLTRNITTRLTDDGAVYPVPPEISPDGKTVLYSSYTSVKNSTADIYTIDVNDFKHMKLTAGGLNIFPKFSFDGNKIVYITVNSVTYDVNVMNKEGKDTRRLATTYMDSRGNSYNPHAVFTPDGKNVVYSGYDGSNVDVYMVSLVDLGLKKLTNDSSREIIECTF